MFLFVKIMDHEDNADCHKYIQQIVRSEKMQNLGGNSTVHYRIQGSQEYLGKINTEDNFIVAL